MWTSGFENPVAKSYAVFCKPLEAHFLSIEGSRQRLMLVGHYAFSTCIE